MNQDFQDSRKSGTATTKATPKTTFKTEEQAKAVVTPVINTFEELGKQMGYQMLPAYSLRFERWMVRLEEGNRIDDRTPFFKDLPRATVVKGFWNVVSKPDNQTNFKPLVDAIPRYAPVWQDVEESQAKNIGPQSIYRPFSQDGVEKVKAVMCDKPPLPSLNMRALEAALDDIRHLLPRGSVHAISIDEAIQGMHGRPQNAMDTKTNAGFPTCKRVWYRTEGTGDDEALDNTMSIVLNDATQLVEGAKKSKNYKAISPQFVAIASQRTVQKGPKPLESKKVKRIVLAMPKFEAVAGKTIMAPLQEKLAEVRNPSGIRIIPAWSPMPVLDKNMQVFLQYAHSHGRTVLSGDISSFDATLPPFLMWMVFQAMSDWLDREAATLFLAIAHGDVYDTSVLMPTGYVKSGPSSVKSGSIFTSLVGCMANYCIQRYGMHAGYYKIDNQCVMGDDFIIDGDGINPDSVSHAFADFGMECHPDKQFFEVDQLHFLQRTHSLGFPGGQASVFRILGNVMSVEDDTQLHYDERNRYAYLFQALARLENGNMNPAFEDLVTYVERSDKLRLGADMTPHDIVQKAGDYATRKMSEAQLKPWKSTGTGVPFDRWAVNRVLRGEKLPPPGYARFKAVYGVPYEAVGL